MTPLTTSSRSDGSTATVSVVSAGMHMTSASSSATAARVATAIRAHVSLDDAVGAGMTKEFDGAGRLKVIEDRVGTGSTDFWAISFSPPSSEQRRMTDKEFDRKIKLLRASWRFFDRVAKRVSAEMRKGPRGGGRDRDRIIRHPIRTESGGS